MTSGLATFRHRWQAFGALPWGQRLERITTAALLVLGIGLRLNGQLTTPPQLWTDEAAWTIRLLTEPLRSLAMRPLGFMWASKQLATHLGASEFWLRFIPNVAGIVALLLLPYVSKRLFRAPLARFFVVFLFALHPALIDLSKEFKPYSSELLLHLLPLVLYLRFTERGRVRDLAALLVALPVSFLFAYNIVFAYPGVLLVALHAAFRRFGRRGALWVCVSGALCLALSVGIYRFNLRGVGGETSGRFWGRKYDVFYVAARGEPTLSLAHAKWLGLRYLDLAAMPGLARESWRPVAQLPDDVVMALSRTNYWILIGLHLAGVALLISQRRVAWLLLLSLPWLVAMGANTFLIWPFGAFRTNLFFCVHAVLLVGFGVEALVRSRAGHVLTFAAIVLTSVLPSLALGFDLHARKTTWSATFDLLQVLAILKEKRELELAADPLVKPEELLIERSTNSVYQYYVRFHPRWRTYYGDYLAHNFRAVPARANSAIRARFRGREPFWIVSSSRTTNRFVQGQLNAGNEVLLDEQVGEEHRLWHVRPNGIARR